MLVKVENGVAVDTGYTKSKLKSDNPNVSFSKNIPETTLNSYGVYTVVDTPRPSYDPNKEKLSLGVSLVDGVWTRIWNVSSLPETTSARNMRAKRDKLLAETDWTALSDVTMSAEMTTYRQALRDITTHANWPNLEEADWPVAP